MAQQYRHGGDFDEQQDWRGREEWQGRGGQQSGFGGGQQSRFGGYGSQSGSREFEERPFWPGAGWDRGEQQQGRRQGRGPKGYKRSDERIKEDICERLMQSDDIDASEVTIEVQDGKVTLQGSVSERRMKHAIEDIADACPGVNDVENSIRVSQ